MHSKNYPGSNFSNAPYCIYEPTLKNMNISWNWQRCKNHALRIYPIGQAKAENESNSCIPLVKELETQEIEISAFFDQKTALVINSRSAKVEIAVDKSAKQIVIAIGITFQTDFFFQRQLNCWLENTTPMHSISVLGKMK